MRWIDPPALSPEAGPSAAIAAGVPPALASILALRGLTAEADVEQYLQPRLRDIGDPFEVAGMAALVDRIHRAIGAAESILIVGDYDVDGVTSTALLLSVLRLFTTGVRAIVPRRLEEGYGLSVDVLERGLEEQQTGLVIAIDCGTNSLAEADWLRQRGTDLVVIDHHQPADESLLNRVPLVNPHACESQQQPWFHLCSVGLAFKVAHGLVKQLRNEGNAIAEGVVLRDYLDLVAMGTVADLVPLVGENRIMVYHGLRELGRRSRPGVAALMDVAGVDRRSTIGPIDISFRLAPRINAGGRLADAALPLQLLLADDDALCRELATQLDAMNRERQEIERAICRVAEERARGMDDRVGVVLYDADWHTGVVGIVAGKLARALQRPCIILGREGNSVKGSGRSFAGVNLVEALSQCTEHLEAWGGHPMAVGVTAIEDEIGLLAEAFNSAIHDLCNGSLPEAELKLGAWLETGDLADSFFDAVARLGPFGQGNPEPVFAVRGTTLVSSPELFGSGNFRFQLARTAGAHLRGIAWRMGESIPPANTAVDLAFRARWNEWNGRKTPQLELIDWRLA